MMQIRKGVSKVLSLMLSLLIAFSAVGGVLSVFAADYPTGYPIDYVNVGDNVVDIIEIAKTQIGYEEGYNDATKYGAWMAEKTGWSGYTNTAWCAMFILWCAEYAGVPSGVIPFAAGCQTMKESFPSSQVYTYADGYTPKAGDIAFFSDYSETDTTYMTHVGIVVSVNTANSTIQIIEGNCTGRVQLLTRPIYGYTYGQYITAYASPKYTTSTVVSVSGVTISKTSISLNEGDSHSLYATIKPSNSTNKALSWSSSDSSVAEVDSSGKVTAKKAGNATITVKTLDGGYTAKCEVTVKSVKSVLKSIEVTSEPDKTIYFQYEAFDKTGMKITAVYSNGTRKDVTSLCTMTGNGTSKVGAKTVTVRYEENGVVCKSMFDFIVNAKLKTLTITSQPTVTEYKIGDKLSLDGMQVIAGYSDSTIKTVTNSCTVSGFDSKTAGDKVVKLSYTDDGITVSTKFTVTVKDNSATVTPQKAKLDKITVTKLPLKTTYFQWEIFDRTGILVEAKYADGTTKDVTADCTMTGNGTSKVGERTVTVRYEENGIIRKVNFNFTVIAKPKVLTVTALPDKTTYFRWEAFDKTGMNVEVTYSDGTKKDVTSLCTLTGNGTSVTGTKTVVARFEEYGIVCKAKFNIEVIGKAKTLTVETMPTKTEYSVGEKFSSNGMKIVAGFSDGSTKDVTALCSFSGFSSQLVGEKTVKASYTENGVTVSVKFKVTVKESNTVKKVSRIEIEKLPDKLTYVAGELFSRTGMKVVAYFSDGTEKDVTNNCKVSGFAYTATSRKEMTVSYTYDNVTVLANFFVTINPKLVKMVIEKKPDKLVYKAGESFDKTGLVMKATLSDSSVKDFTSLCKISGFDSSVAGTQTITVTCTYGTVTVSRTFSVTVVAVVEKIEAEADYFQKKSVNMIDDDFKVTAIYTDGTKIDVTDKVTVSYDNSFGNKTVTVNYSFNGRTFTDTITVFIY